MIPDTQMDDAAINALIVQESSDTLRKCIEILGYSDKSPYRKRVCRIMKTQLRRRTT